MAHTPNTNPQAQGETAEGISTKSIQNYLKWNCGAMDTAEEINGKLSKYFRTVLNFD